MGIFARRAVKCPIDTLESCSAISRQQRSGLLARLNKRTQDALSAEWEVILLSSLSSTARVVYEKPFGRIHLDLFAVAESNGLEIEFVAEIVAISDIASEKQNPSDSFFSEFRRVAQKHDCGDGGFDIRIGDKVTGEYPNKRTTLLLPPRSEIPAFVERELKPFFERVRLDRRSPLAWKYQRDEIDIQVTFEPKRLGGNTGGYACAASPLSLRENRLFRALNDKAHDLRQSGYKGIAGILATDNGCRALAAIGGGLGAWSRDQIVRQFLREHPHVQFVTTTTYETRGGWGRRDHTLSNRIYWQGNVDQEAATALLSVLNNMFGAVPPVCEAPYNALSNLRNRLQVTRTCQLGAYKRIPNHHLSISSRTFVGLLAGTLSQQDYRLLFYRPSPLDGGPLVRFFRNIAELRLPIARTWITQQLDQDDDVISFEVGPSPFDDVAQKSAVGTDWCSLSVKGMTRYLAGLDYRPNAVPHQSSLGAIPNDIRQFLRGMESHGRMVIEAEVINEGKQVRLNFGDRDAAISDYF